MDRPLVSVIVTVSDGERYVSSALHSIIRQNYYPFDVEIIVINGHCVMILLLSPDRSGSCILSDGKQFCGRRTSGIEAAQGDHRFSGPMTL